MKKIISLIAAVSMACSALVTSAYAADALTVETTTKVLTNEEFKEYWEEDIPAGKTAYSVIFEVADLPELGYTKTAGNKNNPKYTGSALDNMEIILSTADDMSGIDQDYSCIYDYATAVAPTAGFGEGLWSVNYSGNRVYPSAPDETIVGKSEGYMEMWFLVDSDDEITFTPDGAFSVISYTDNNIDDQKDYATAYGTVSFSPATITLAPEKEPEPEPDPEPTAPVVTGTDAGVVVTDGVNGKVWNEVKVENTTLGTNYRAKFTETTTGKTSIHKFQNFGEVGGTAEFAVILNTLKDVANITLEIIYDAVQ